MKDFILGILIVGVADLMAWNIAYFASKGWYAGRPQQVHTVNIKNVPTQGDK